MDIDIHLENNTYPWKKIEMDDWICWAKGDLIDNEEFIKGSTILSSRSSQNTDDGEALNRFLLGFNGSFAFVIKTPDRLLCVVDRIRSIPLFYTITDTCLFISDDANYLRDRLNPPFDEINGAEFIVTGYVTGSMTLFEGINQIQPGEYLLLGKGDSNPTMSFYHRFWHENIYTDPEEALLDRLDMVFISVFQRLKESVQGQGTQIVVPLSGGLDSRIIVSMLRRCGVDDVICFSYGRKGDREAKISQQVAETLGYQWHFVEYTKNNCNMLPETIKEYKDYAGNLVSSPHLQDFFAVKYLIENGIISRNAIFVPGHSGDMLAGSHMPQVSDTSQDFSIETLSHYIMNKHYSLWDWDRASQLCQVFTEKIKAVVADVEINDDESWANAIELWDYNERQAKFIVNSVRVYEFFGFLWRIPLWDNELIDFFKRVPQNYRMSQYLYRKYAVEKLFVNALYDVGQIDCTTPLFNQHPPISAVQGFLGRCKMKGNLIMCFFSFDIGCAIEWAVSRQNVSLLKIKSRIFGYWTDSYREYRVINDIIVYSHNTRSVPSINGLGAHAYLAGIIDEI